MWIPKFKIVFADMLKGKYIASVLMYGQWMTTTYNERETYVPNLQSERGRKVGVWRKA